MNQWLNASQMKQIAQNDKYAPTPHTMRRRIHFTRSASSSLSMAKGTAREDLTP